MSNYNSNYEIAQAISERIGAEPIPFDSVYEICLQIYNELGGEPEQFDSVYEILLGILPLVGGGIASKVIDDESVASNKTWSSDKINSELEALAGDANSEIVASDTIDVTFVDVVPTEAGEEGQYVIYTTEAEDTLYKYENGAWEVQTIDANKLYFDTEHNLLYAYKSATHKFAEVAVDNTIIFSGSMTSNAAKTALNPVKTPGVYNVLQHSKSGSKTTMTNWVMTVTFLDSNEADEVDGSVYQKLENNYTVYKRYYKPATDTWTSMTKYYEGLVRDALTSSAYYTWSVNKIKNAIAAAVAEVPQLEAGENISIEDGKINAVGYKASNSTTSSFVELPEIKIEPYIDMTSQLPTTDLNFTGDAGATEYTVSGQLSSMLSSMIGGAAFQVGSGNIALLTAYDSTNSKVTLDKTLDENNALSATPMSKLYVAVFVVFSGSANATTYSYTDMDGEFNPLIKALIKEGDKIKIGNYDLRTITAISSNSITLDYTLDANNAVSNAVFIYALASNNTASGIQSHAEGGSTTASGNCSHSEGQQTISTGDGSHAEGRDSIAIGFCSHAEGAAGSVGDTYGGGNVASGFASHAEGTCTKATGKGAHAEGGNMTSTEANWTTASGTYSHAEGYATQSQGQGEHAEGCYNVSHKANDNNIDNSHPNGDAGNTQHSVGIGYFYGSPRRKNALEIMQNGDMYVYGVGNYQGTNTKVQDATIKTLQEYIASLEARIAALEGA